MAEAIGTGNGKVAKEIRKQGGLVKFTFTQDHGKNEKGDVKEMHKSTAMALAHHKIGTVGAKVKKKIVKEN